MSNNETFEIYNESGLSTAASDTIINKENSQSSDNNSQYIPKIVTSISDNTPIKTYINLPKINDHIVYINPEFNTNEK